MRPQVSCSPESRKWVKVKGGWVSLVLEILSKGFIIFPKDMEVLIAHMKSHYVSRWVYSVAEDVLHLNFQSKCEQMYTRPLMKVVWLNLCLMCFDRVDLLQL